MKTDRLYALTLYLLNHGKSSASELAKHFEVSVRTIQSDIDALCQAEGTVVDRCCFVTGKRSRDYRTGAHKRTDY